MVTVTILIISGGLVIVIRGRTTHPLTSLGHYFKMTKSVGPSLQDYFNLDSVMAKLLFDTTI